MDMAQDTSLRKTRFRVLCAYDGTDYDGWQSQPSGNAIQDWIERAIEAVLKERVRIHGAGRTDAGVHANGQVFHFDASWKHPAGAMRRALQSNLPESVLLRSVAPVPEDFHARYSVVGKRYLYRLHPGEPMPTEVRYCTPLPARTFHLGKANKLGPIFRGKHDFTAFSARGSGEENAVKELKLFEIRQVGEEYHLIVEGTGFLYKMVRYLADAVIKVGTGKAEPASIQRILGEGKRSHLLAVAPPQGLFLDEVWYG